MRNTQTHRFLAVMLSLSVFCLQITPVNASNIQSVSQNALSEESVSENQMDEDASFDRASELWQQETDTIVQTETERTKEDGQENSEGENGKETQEPEETTPAKVTGVSVTRLSYQANQITVPVMPQVVGYEIYRSTKADGSDRIELTGEQSASDTCVTYTDINTQDIKIEVGTTYYYWVRAYIMGVETNEQTQEKQTVRVYGEYSDAVGITMYLDRVTGLLADSLSYQSNEITWNAVGGADGYYVYYALSQEGPFALAGQMSGNLANHFTHETTENGTNLMTGTTYYYKVCAYQNTSAGVVLSEDSLVCWAKPSVAAPDNLSAQSLNYKTLQISFEQVEGASGYEIYRSTKADKGFRRIALLKKGSKVTYQDKKCNTGMKYYYKIRAYRKQNSGTVYGEYSDTLSAIAMLPKPKLLSATLISGDTVSVKWKKVTGAQGYVIYRSESKKGTYKKVLTVSSNVDNAQIGGQENGKTFYYKVKAYRKVSAKKRYSDYSNVKYAVFNWFASRDESYPDKARRIFGKDYYQKYSSAAEAQAHMTTIAIQVWDFAPDKVTKVTKTKMLTVNANIAETVKQIFKEIYEGEERFPIKNVGGYSWRGDASTSEHCCGLAIDINWEENCLIDNGVVISGKYWKPGEDPYSIPLDSEVVTIMEKYGFSRGMWGNRIDYMHFSYFGT